LKTVALEMKEGSIVTPEFREEQKVPLPEGRADYSG
jgi:hypothetical protein